MLNAYADIRDAIPGAPSWWDEHGVPRYVLFAPSEVANSYADEAALVLIACQGCGEKFQVAFSQNRHGSLADIMRGQEPKTLAAVIEDGILHYGDPPNTGCCCAGATMNCDDLRVLEYWTRDDSFEWQRKPGLEVPLADADASETATDEEDAQRGERNADSFVRQMDAALSETATGKETGT